MNSIEFNKKKKKYIYIYIYKESNETNHVAHLEINQILNNKLLWNKS